MGLRRIARGAVKQKAWAMTYRLYYWPGIQGRGEFIRLALEEAGADYVDVARGDESHGQGVPALMALLKDHAAAEPPFAPPFLKDGEMVVSQVANILQHLAPKLGLAPEGEALGRFAHGLQLTIADVVAEVHDTHHPLSASSYYEDQKDAAKARSADFIRNRMPKYLGYFERVLENNPKGSDQAVGDGLTTVDLSLFQLVAGLAYAFPKATADFAKPYPKLGALRAAVARRPNIARYLASDRRLAFNEQGIFRHYPELDRAG